MISHGNVMVVDDDQQILDIVERCLEDEGFRVTTFSRGRDAKISIQSVDYDLAIIDIGLPDIDGFTLTGELKSNSQIAVIILSGRNETIDKVVGLEIGADDYVTKPFEPRELIARVRSLVRRLRPPSKDDEFQPRKYLFDGWEIDVDKRTLYSNTGLLAELTSGEFDLLKIFLEHPNRVLSRDQLMDYLNRDYTAAFDRSIDIRLGRLRRKIEKDSRNPELIKTIRNSGYIFTAKVQRK